MLLNSVSNTAMEKALGAIWQRQQAIANNIANEETPGYKAKRVAFESLLKNELDGIQKTRTGKREALNRLKDFKAVEYEQDNLVTRADGNNVDLDNEHIEMARTTLFYNTLEQRVNSYYSSLKYAIKGGR